MLKLPLFDYQEKTMQYLAKREYCIVALKMGLGKSVLPIAHKAINPDSRVLIVCPAGLILNWKKEINKFYKNPSCTIFKKGGDFYYPVDSDFVVCSYDLAIKNPYLFEWANVVALDEATLIKEMKTKRTEAIHRHIYENSIERVMLLTGTPIKNRVQEFYSLISICNYNPKIKESEFLKRFPDSITFADHFSYRTEFDMDIGHKFVRVIKWTGLKNEQELKKWLAGIYISMDTNQPPINYKNVALADFDDSKLLAEFLSSTSELSGVKSNVKAEAALRKVPLTYAYISSLIESGDIEGPVIIYTDHRESCYELARLFGVTGITGEMSVTQRQKKADELQEGKSDFLVATFGSFSQGYTLTRSNFMAINDYPWSPGDISQAEFRINRTGQTRPCHVHRIFGSEQDEYIFDTIMSKKEVLDRTF